MLSYRFKKHILLFFFSTALLFSFAQVAHVGGFLNKYAAVTVIDYCENKVTVDDASQFAIGQKIILMQMAGASVDGSNTASYGNLLNYNNSGNYEIETIKTITGNVVEFTYAIARNYDVSGLVQIVWLPEYHIVAIDSTLKGLSWNGAKGGVIALKADSIILNDSVNARGIGFRGGPLINDSAAQPCYNGGIGGATDYYCSNLNCGAAKGQGIGSAGFAFGRGKHANGGGGGDDHNTGGGGGANVGAGGIGGTRSNASNFNCPGPASGVGGQPLLYTNGANTIFMGGGGGAGDENNNEGTEGGHGGGIVIFIANTLVGNNKKINANGNAETALARSDGAGGGGGGGTVLLFVDNYVGTVQVYACGGKGGNLDNGGSQTNCMGPGGGGGGGMLWVKTNSIPGNINYIDTGGYNGKDTYGLGPAVCPYGTTNGALPGTAGGSLTGLNIPVDSVPFVKLALTACCDTTVCPNQSVYMSEWDTSTYPATVLWSNGFIVSSFTQPVSSTTAFTVTITDNHGCQLTETHTATVYNPIAGVVTCCDTTVCPGAMASFNVTAPAVPPLTYLWSTGATTTSITQQISTPRTFYITVTDPNGCTLSQSVDAHVSNTFPNFSVCCDTVMCGAGTVTFTAATTASPVNYIWSSGQTTASISQAISSTQTFTVSVSNASGCSAELSVNATISNVPPVFTVCCDTTLCPGGTVLANAVSDSVLTYQWSSGQNTSSITQQIFSSQTFVVTATNNRGCTAQATLNATVNNVPPPFSVCCDTVFCTGGTLLANASSDSALTYVWSSGQITAAISQQVLTSQAFTVTATNTNGCYAQRSVNVTINNFPPVFTICCDTAFCVSGTLLAGVSSVNALTYNWSSGQTTASIAQQISTAQSVSVTVTDANGCTAEDFVDVLIGNIPPVFTLCCDTVVCPNGTVNIVVNSMPNSSFTYVWSGGQQTSFITEQISSSKTYAVSVTDQNGCTGSASVDATVSNTAAVFSVCCDTVVCEGSQAVFTASAVEQTNYVWSSGETTAIISPVISSQQTFSVTATNAGGCTGTKAVQANTSLAHTSITAVPDTNFVSGQPVQLTAAGDSGYTYLWSSSETLDSVNSKNPTATPLTTTTYCVTATDKYGCVDSACYKVEINLPGIKVPDAFSPNGDGRNDVFTIFPLSSDIVEIRIYNRWGEVVFYSKGNAAWDGTYKGKIQEAGNFVCQVSYTNSLSPGKTNTVVKDILLVR